MMYKTGTPDGERNLVLLIEDDFVLRTGLAETLREEGFRVESAASGDEALRRLGVAPKPSLILLDLMLPHMDGIEFRMAQRSSPGITDIPVIVITAFDIDPRLKEELKLSQVIRKPLDVPVLLGAMSAAIAAAAA